MVFLWSKACYADKQKISPIPEFSAKNGANPSSPRKAGSPNWSQPPGVRRPFGPNGFMSAVRLATPNLSRH